VSAGAVRAVILAAGTSSRVGRQKLLMECRGCPLIEHAIAAAQLWNPVVVASRDVAEYLAGRQDLELVRNDQPDLGMAHSLRLASLVVPAGSALIVLLGDKPLVTPALIKTVCSASANADVVYPVRGEEPGHPVWISPRARRAIGALPPGDTLRFLRADPELTTIAIETHDEGAFFDVDTVDAFERSEL
jgi:molybdenum cofactor cytidylyltransferase